MPTPGFEPGTLDEIGCPVWISDLANDDPNHLVHVVRDLEPAEALGMRAICVLAELPRTLADLRRIPLLVAPLESS
ncbi:hypothetical protein [Amycolatopsis pigmentata]|uniref:Uncharacterized protein n=1 Tax=Amycolatopsis pigmentata TaxID=450801 RepID=A0ABW5G2B8_9PSEU